MLVVRFDSDQPHGPSPGRAHRRAYGHGCAGTDTGRPAPPQRGPRATAAAAGPGARYGWWVRRVSVNPPKFGLPVLGTVFRVPPESYASATGFWISSNPNIYFFDNMVMDL